MCRRILWIGSRVCQMSGVLQVAASDCLAILYCWHCVVLILQEHTRVYQANSLDSVAVFPCANSVDSQPVVSNAGCCTHIERRFEYCEHSLLGSRVRVSRIKMVGTFHHLCDLSIYFHCAHHHSVWNHLVSEGRRAQKKRKKWQ